MAGTPGLAAASRPESAPQGNGTRCRRTGGGVGKRKPAASPRGPGPGAGGSSMKLTHLDDRGRPRMVDVGDKPESERTAVAEGAVRMSPEAFELVATQAVAKG